VAGTEIAPGVFTEESGMVLEVKPGWSQWRFPPLRTGVQGSEVREEDSALSSSPSTYEVTLRIARPYVSAWCCLAIMDRGLVQRGDNLVLLVFER